MSHIALKDCLGRKRAPLHVYEDGSYNCPFCTYAVCAGTPEFESGTCPNPACVARAGFPAGVALEQIEATERREREEQARELAAKRKAAEEKKASLICREPGCGGNVYGQGRCKECIHQSSCSVTRCRNVAPSAFGGLCRACAAQLHPGRVMFLGRWRTMTEFVERVQGDKAFRRVKWTLQGETLVGVDGTFEMRLRTTLRIGGQS